MEAPTSLVCPNCQNADQTLIEHLCDVANNTGWYRRYFCSVCGKGWDVLEILHADRPATKHARHLR